MRVAYVITGLACGGAESQLATLVQEMSKKCTVKVFSIATNVDILDRFIGIDIEIIPMRSPFAFFKLLKSMREFIPDIIHSHMIHSNIVSVLISRLLRTVCFCTSHNTNEGGILRMFTLSFLYRSFKPHISHVSDVGIRLYVDKLQIKSEIKKYINPVDFSRFVTLKSKNHKDHISWINVASLTKQKRHDRLLNTFQKYLMSYPDDKLYIVGTGPNFIELDGMIKSLGISDNVFLLGRRNDIPALLSNSDYFVMSSDWEGLPVSIIESLRVGVPVVSTDCGDISEVVKNGVNGIVCNPNKDSLLNAMLSIRDQNENSYLKMASNCCKSVSSYDVVNIAYQLLRDYDFALSNPKL